MYCSMESPSRIQLLAGIFNSFYLLAPNPRRLVVELKLTANRANARS